MTDVKLAISDFLSRHNTMSLATVSPDGAPCCVSLFYVSSGFTLYFISRCSSVHSRNISLSPDVSITIHRDYRNWECVTGLRIKGKAFEVSDIKYEYIKQLYQVKFPTTDKIIDDPKLSAETVFYKVIPRSIRLIDNRIAFGYKREVLI